MGGIWGAFVGFLEQTLLWFAIATGNMGIGIILFTICARLFILPLTLSSIRSSRKMQELQPMIKELQRKHGKDQKKLQEETIKLYQQYRINPVGGCLPMFLQLPIFIGVYWAVLHLLDPRTLNPLLEMAYTNPVMAHVFQQFGVSEAVAYLLEHPLVKAGAASTIFRDPSIPGLLTQPFLGIDLGTRPFSGGFSAETFNGIQYLVLPVVSIVLQLTQQMMAMPRVQDPQQKAMSRAMMFMPLFFAYITLIFPAGAVLYWTTSSVVGILQQYFTSGWGSLANHLKFLPPDGKTLLSGKTEATAAETSQETENTPAAAPQRPMFWQVLSPLTEASGDDGGARATSSSSASNTPSKESTGEKTSRQKQKQTNPRRSRRRRS